MASALGRAIQVLFRICEHCGRAKTCGDAVELEKYLSMPGVRCNNVSRFVFFNRVKIKILPVKFD